MGDVKGTIVLLLIAVMILYAYHFGLGQQHGGLQQMTITNKFNEPYYARQYRELDDVDNVLNRPIKLGNRCIQRLKGLLS